MGKSLGDYTIEKSSSADIKNIKWTQKNPKDTDKLKKKKTDKKFQNSSASNCKIKQGFKRPAR
ncbi:MAG: hypothetical protein HRO68_02490 [Nitrosopumilus sp.]|nr:hypothetical protein [Nitrosopumilus sp.]